MLRTRTTVILGALLVLGALSPRAASASRNGSPFRADSTDAIKRVRLLLHNLYRYGGLSAYRGTSAYRDALQYYCDGARGFICHGGDPDAGPCDVDTLCHLPEGHLIDVLKETTAEYPESAFLNGQAVYALVKFARNVEAGQVADACKAAPWFCEALKGYVLASDGRTRAAEPHLRTAMEEAPDWVRCIYTDATWLLGTWQQRDPSLRPPGDHRETRDWSCAKREAVSDTLWWLADPLYSVPGNARWTEHVVRSLSARFAAEIRESSPYERAPRDYPDFLWARRVRRGAWDSWEHLRSPRGYDNSIGTVVWTSEPKAANHFMPDVSPDDLSHPVWSLEAHREDEGYTPDSGPFLAVPVQLARFRAGDTLVVAGAASLTGTGLVSAPDKSTRLVLTDVPGSFPASVPGDATRPGTPVFLARAPERDYVASVEVVSSRGVAWHRETLEGLRPGTPAVSDVLLYEPDGENPATVKDAAGAMLGSTRVEKGGHVGVFWQTYGVPAGTSLSFELSVERASGGLVSRLGRLIEGRTEEAPGRLTWSEPGTAGTDARGVVLDLADLDSGGYTLVLRVSWDGQAPLVRRRSFSVS